MEVRSEALPRAAASGAVCLLSGTGSGRFLGGRAGTAVSPRALPAALVQATAPAALRSTLFLLPFVLVCFSLL